MQNSQRKERSLENDGREEKELERERSIQDKDETNSTRTSLRGCLYERIRLLLKMLEELEHTMEILKREQEVLASAGCDAVQQLSQTKRDIDEMIQKSIDNKESLKIKQKRLHDLERTTFSSQDMRKLIVFLNKQNSGDGPDEGVP